MNLPNEQMSIFLNYSSDRLGIDIDFNKTEYVEIMDKADKSENLGVKHEAS